MAHYSPFLGLMFFGLARNVNSSLHESCGHACTFPQLGFSHKLVCTKRFYRSDSREDLQASPLTGLRRNLIFVFHNTCFRTITGSKTTFWASGPVVQ